MTQKKFLPWIEKYRPKTFQEVIGLPEGFEKIINPSMPHLLLISGAGRGKTSTARIIIKSMEAEFLELNSSKDRTIDVVRSLILSFAKTASLNGKIKIIFLDEADGLLEVTQQSLRNVMETYVGNVRFILSCNNESKIIEPIKSRCSIYRFENFNETECFNYLTNILGNEEKDFEEEAIYFLIQKYSPDIRGMVNILQSLSFSKGKILLEDVKKSKTKFEVVIDFIKKKDFDGVKKSVSESECEQMFSDIYFYIMEDEVISYEKKRKITEEVAMPCNYYMMGSLIKKISFNAFIFGLLRIL